MVPEFPKIRPADSNDRERPSPNSGIDASTPQALERACLDLFYGTSVELSGRYTSVVFLNDQHLRPIRGRDFQDVHAFFELRSGAFFHLRAYGSHMSEHPDIAREKGAFLTAYYKDGVHLDGGSHAIRQDWYAADPKALAREILTQTDLFEIGEDCRWTKPYEP